MNQDKMIIDAREKVAGKYRRLNISIVQNSESFLNEVCEELLSTLSQEKAKAFDEGAEAMQIVCGMAHSMLEICLAQKPTNPYTPKDLQVNTTASDKTGELNRHGFHILGCAFCGNLPIWINEIIPDSHYYLKCEECQFVMKADRRDKVVAMWNRRPNDGINQFRGEMTTK